jgi:hypothetical protein
MSQIKSGFQRAASWLLGILWLGLVFAGIGIAFTPNPHSPILGWCLLGAAGLILVLLIDRCIRVFAALMAVGTVSSFVAIFSGRMNASPIPLSQGMALGLMLFFAASTALALTFVARKLNVVDRIAVLVFLSSIFWQAATGRIVVLALAAGFCALLVAWSYDRIRRRGHRPAALP